MKLIVDIPCENCSSCNFKCEEWEDTFVIFCSDCGIPLKFKERQDD